MALSLKRPPPDEDNYQRMEVPRASIRVLDLDGSVTAQADLLARLGATVISAQHWGPQVRLACTFRAFNRFRHWLAAALPADGPRVTFTGSGDFHHVTLALVEQVREPFNLLVLDK